MKRIVFVFAIVLCGAIQAQTYDTVSGRNGILPNYYYPDGWFDTCIGFYETNDTPENYPDNPKEWGAFSIGGDGGISICCPDGPLPPYCTVYEHHVDGPVAFTGVAVMMIDYYETCIPEESACDLLNDTILPDTVYILCPDSSGELRVVASAIPQMDTTPHKVWKFPINVDSAVYGFRYVDLYEHKFDHPVVVDSLYYLYGTSTNRVRVCVDCDPNNPHYLYHPYSHAIVFVDDYVQHLTGEPYTPCNPNQGNGYLAKMDNSGKLMYRNDVCFLPGNYVDWWGPYLLMVDSCTIEVGSADSAMGTAGPTRSMSKWVTQTITATPEYGYRFSHWDDGNTENPRDIYLTQDTHFVAYFEPHPRHTVQTRCEPEGKGIISGDGLYWEGDMVTLTARPVAPYVFHHWDDGNRDNPRRFAIGQDTVFTAYLMRQLTDIGPEGEDESVFTLTPNPTTGKVMVEIRLPQPLSDNTLYREGPLITVRDAAGHEVLHRTVPEGQAAVEIDLSTLPAGTYFVTLTAPTLTATRRLVVR